MRLFSKKEFTIKTPFEAYKFTPGVYIIEVSARNIPRNVIAKMVNQASQHDVTIIPVFSEGDTVALYPVKSVKKSKS